MAKRELLSNKRIPIALSVSEDYPFPITCSNCSRRVRLSGSSVPFFSRA